MPLPNWWEVTTPHRDIIEGRFDESVFAADLGNVLIGNAPVEYQDGATFFQKTFLTKGLEELFTTVWKRLSGSGKGQAVIQLQTPFGGGKTHALLGLYHMFGSKVDLSHTDIIKQMLEKTGSIEMPKVKVAAFVGTHADALGGRTPWGEIAYQLGCYDIVKEHDQKRIAPGKERLLEVLEKSGPTLILIDELLQYIVKKDRAEKIDQIEQGQTVAFMQEMTEAVASMPQTALVVTLPSSVLEQYDEQAEKALHQFQRVIGRVETIYTPVEGVEIYEIIRKRLFENLGDRRIHAKVAQWYFSLYHELHEDVPPDVKSVEYRNKIERSYPFHPELIDVLRERWGSYSSFQRTRGVLRLLAEAIGDLYKKRKPGLLIHSSMIPLDNPAMRREFIKHIGNEYDAIIAADIGEPDSKAPQIDRQMGSEYAKQSIATSLATAVFLYSFSGGTRKGMNLRELRVAVLREGIPKTIIGDAVKHLEEELWFFHSSSGLYAFKNQANINRVIIDREEQVKVEEIAAELRTIINRYIGSEIETFIWPRLSSDIPDTRKIKLILLPFELPHPGTKCDSFIEELFRQAGAGYRVYKNGLLILAVDDNIALNLKKSIKRHLALISIQSSPEMQNRITKNDLADLSRKIIEVKNQITYELFLTYRYLAYLNGEGVRWIDLGQPSSGSQNTLSSRVKDFLVNEEILLERISPRVLVNYTKLGPRDEKRINDIFEMFLKIPNLPLLWNQETLYGAIRLGVTDSVFGLKKNGEVTYGEQLFDVDGEMSLIGPDLAKELIGRQVAEPGPEMITTGTAIPTATDKTAEHEPNQATGKIESLPKHLTLSAIIPWDKISSIVGGVIGPLKAKDAQLKIKVEVTAISEKGFDRTTLDTRIKETLQQIGAQIEIWQED